MVITFEEEHKSPVKNIIIVVVVVAVLGGIGYFGYSYVTEQSKSALLTEAKKVDVTWTTLKDPRLDSLEKFPEIAPYQGDLGKENPFY